MVKETLGLPVHLHFREPLPLLKNLGPVLLMRSRTLPPSFFRVIRRGIAQRVAGSRHLKTRRGCFFSGLLAVRLCLLSFLSSVELHLPSSFTYKPAVREYVYSPPRSPPGRLTTTLTTLPHSP